MNLEEAVRLVTATRDLNPGHPGSGDYFNVLEALYKEMEEKSEHWPRAAMALVVAFRNALRGEIIYVSQEMMGLVEHASRSLPDEPLLKHEPLVTTGVCLTEKRIMIPLVTGKLPHGLGAYAGWSWHCDGGDVVFSSMLVERNGLLLPVSVDNMYFGSRPMDCIDPALREDEDFHRRVMLRTLWTIARQRLTRREKGPPRVIRRRLEKEGVEVPTTTTLLLRAFEQRKRDGESDLVDWSHRWLVSGHWRNQWIPSLSTHRQQWIAPYVKGPEDRPLVLKDRRIAIVR